MNTILDEIPIELRSALAEIAHSSNKSVEWIIKEALEEYVIREGGLQLSVSEAIAESFREHDLLYRLLAR